VRHEGGARESRRSCDAILIGDRDSAGPLALRRSPGRHVSETRLVPAEAPRNGTNWQRASIGHRRVPSRIVQIGPAASTPAPHVLRCSPGVVPNVEKPRNRGSSSRAARVRERLPHGMSSSSRRTERTARVATPTSVRIRAASPPLGRPARLAHRQHVPRDRSARGACKLGVSAFVQRVLDARDPSRGRRALRRSFCAPRR